MQIIKARTGVQSACMPACQRKQIEHFNDFWPERRWGDVPPFASHSERLSSYRRLKTLRNSLSPSSGPAHSAAAYEKEGRVIKVNWHWQRIRHQCVGKRTCRQGQSNKRTGLCLLDMWDAGAEQPDGSMGTREDGSFWSCR